MTSQNGQMTAKIKFGEFFVREFFNDEDRVFCTQELENMAINLGINHSNVRDIINRDFAGVIVADRDGNFSLNEDYLAGDFLVYVNLQRKERNIEPLERPTPNRVERSGS